jgi:tetratricopeptide (TPR) repeat protein
MNDVNYTLSQIIKILAKKNSVFSYKTPYWANLTMSLGITKNNIPTYVVSNNNNIYLLNSKNNNKIHNDHNNSHLHPNYKAVFATNIDNPNKIYISKKYSKSFNFMFTKEIRAYEALNIQYDYCCDQDCYLFYEFIEGTPLYKVAIGELTFFDKVTILLSIIEQVTLMHAKNLLHLDLRANNIILKNLSAFIIDYDTSVIIKNCYFPEQTELFYNNNELMPPELTSSISGTKYNYISQKTDVWYIGKLLTFFGIDKNVDDAFKNIIYFACEDEQNKRPFLDDIKKHLQSLLPVEIIPQNELDLIDKNELSIEAVKICDFCNMPITDNCSWCNSCGLNITTNQKILHNKMLSDGWTGRDTVYTGITDGLNNINDNINLLTKHNIVNIDRFYSVCGGGTWLHYLSILEPKKIVLFDINPYAIQYTRLLVELITISPTKEQFIQNIYCRNINTFISKYGELNFFNQFKYLSMPYIEKYYYDCISQLSPDSLICYNTFIKPFHFSQVTENNPSRIKNLLPCWLEEFSNPPVDNTGIGIIYSGRLKGKNFPSTATLYYNHGWLLDQLCYAQVRNKVINTVLEYSICDAKSIIYANDQQPALYKNKIIYHFSNIFDDFIPCEYNKMIETLLNTDNGCGKIFLAILTTKKHLDILVDHRQLNSKTNTRYNSQAYNYFKDQSFSNMYNQIVQKIVSYNATKILDVGCWDGVLLNQMQNIAYYCGIDISNIALENCVAFKKAFHVNMICGNFMDLPAPADTYDLAYFGGILGTLKTSVKHFDYHQIFSLLDNYFKKYKLKKIIIQEPIKYYQLQPIIDLLPLFNFEIVDRFIVNTDLAKKKYVGDGVLSCVIGDDREIICIQKTNIKYNDKTEEKKNDIYEIAVIIIVTKEDDGLLEQLVDPSILELTYLCKEIFIFCDFNIEHEVSNISNKTWGHKATIHSYKHNHCNIKNDMLHIVYSVSKCKFALILDFNYKIKTNLLWLKNSLLTSSTPVFTVKNTNSTTGYIHKECLVYRIKNKKDFIDFSIIDVDFDENLPVAELEIFHYPTETQLILQNERLNNYIDFVKNESQQVQNNFQNYNIAVCYQQLGDFTNAKKHYDIYVADDKNGNPRLFEAYYNMALCSTQLNEPWSVVFPLYEKSLYHQTRIEPLVKIADYYRLQKNSELAFAFARSACELKPNHNYYFLDTYISDYWRWVILCVLAWERDYYLGYHAAKMALTSSFTSDNDKKNMDLYLNGW